MGAVFLLLPDPGSLSQNLRRWLHHGLELPCLSQWGPYLSHPPASIPPPRLPSSAPFSPKSLPSEALLLILAPGPSLLTSFQTPRILLSLETLMLTTQPGAVSSPLTHPEVTCFAGSLPLVWKSQTTSPLIFDIWYMNDLASSSDISLALASLAPHIEWCTLPGLSSDHLPIEIVLPLSPVRYPNTCPPQIQLQKGPLGCLPIIYSWTSPLSWCWLRQHPPGCPLLFPLLSQSCQDLYPLWPPWSFPRSLVVQGSGICSVGATEGPLRETTVWGPGSTTFRRGRLGAGRLCEGRLCAGRLGAADYALRLLCTGTFRHRDF